MRRDHRPVPPALLTKSRCLVTLGDRRDVTCPGHKQRSRRSRNGSSGYSESRQRRLAWLVHVTAIITSCEPPKVVGGITSSVTVTGVPEVYGLPKTDRNHVRLPARSCLPIRDDWLEGDADPRAYGPVGPEASLYPMAEVDD